MSRKVTEIELKYKQIAHEGIRKALEQFSVGGDEAPRSKVGSKQLADNSIRAYEKHFRSLNAFLGMIGDYESILMLLPKSPSFCPSINAESIYQFVKWKRGKKSERLLSSQGHVVRDVLDEVVYCSEAWSCESNAQTFFGAITCIHNAFGYFGDYTERCDACVALKDEDNDDTGCMRHKYSPKFWRSGNPVKSILSKNALRFNTIDSKSHKSNASKQLLPDQVEMLRNHLIGQNDVMRM